MKSVVFFIVLCLLLSVNISLCSETNCEIESETCELENGTDVGECKVISQCESGLFAQNITNYPEGSNELVCCRHVRQTRNAKLRSRAYILIRSHPTRQRYRYNKSKPQKIKATVAPTPPSFKVAVVGGENAKSGEFPFMAALGWLSSSSSYDYRCGGFFVSPNRVVTAGHCARSRGIAPVVVRPGGLNLDARDNNLDISIAKIIPHPSYRSRQSYNDIAVLKLSGNSPHPSAKLWRSSAINFPSAIAIGYGHKNFAGTTSNILQKVTLSLFGNSFCSRFYRPERKLEQGLISSQLCAGELKKIKDTCQGDSGGPLLVRQKENGKTVPYIIGITSFGTGCGGGVPSVYTRISSYASWIESVQ